MPLSEYEQRVLDALERDLGTDPKLKNAMDRSPRSSSRVAGAVVGVVAGLGVILAGVMAQQPIVGVAGFVLMIGVALWALVAPTRSTRSPKAATGRGRGKRSKPTFMERLDQRFEKRREQGGA